MHFTVSGFWKLQKIQKAAQIQFGWSRNQCVSALCWCWWWWTTGGWPALLFWPEIAPGKGFTIPTSDTSSLLQNLIISVPWQNIRDPPICKVPCPSENSLNDLHFVIFMLVQPWVWATENYFSFIIPQFWCFNLIFLWCNLQLDKCEEYSIFKHSTCCWTSVRNIIALLGFQLQIQLPAKVFFATLDKSFFWLILIELSVLFKVEIFFWESISTIQI